MIVLLAIAQLASTTAGPGSGGAAGGSPAAVAPGGSRASKVQGGTEGARPATAPPPTHVDADNIEYRYKERQTVMTGKPLVTLRREDAVLVCRKLVADNDAGGDIHHAVCEGDVKLTRVDRVVTCARATYEAGSGRVVCRGDSGLPGGDPVLHDGASIIHCDEVIYDLDQDRVFLKKPKGTLVQKPGQPPPIAKGKSR